ncbi:MAG: hypothetical protein AAF430_11495 [Myxococcota bacterium]
MSSQLLRLFHLGLLVAFAFGAVACSIQQEVVLAVEEGASIEVTIPNLEPQTSNLSGGLKSQLDIDISFLRILFGLPLNGTIDVTEILIAGSGFPVIPPFPLQSTLCQYADPADPGGGSVSVSLASRQLGIQTTANALIVPVDPIVLSLFGGEPIPFPVAIDVTAPITLLDLLGVIGGGDLPLSLVQELDFVFESENPLLDGLTITGELPLSTAEAIPDGPLVSECETFLDGFLP